ncbi:MAG: PTS sugar transporter subunit IIA [Candidatus Latescibacterota bacterium]|jgi:PTS system fructose-specific IIA component
MPATETQPATIGTLLREENVRLGLEATDKTALIRDLVTSLSTESKSNLEEVADAVLERERRLSTGVGYGVALPHAKTPAMETTEVMMAVLAEPLDFDSFDGDPVRLVFLMVGPPSASRQHIQMLGRVSRILNDESTRKKLLAAETAAEVVSIFVTAEGKLSNR